jgi:hypothetical protein
MNYGGIAGQNLVGAYISADLAIKTGFIRNLFMAEAV